MNREGIVLVLMGPMGCGKTTIGKALSEKTGWPFYDGDDFHPPSNIEKMRQGIPLNDDDRKPWLQTLRSKISRWKQESPVALLACSALKATYRELLGIDQDRVISIYLKGSLSLLKERIAGRNHQYMPDELLQSQLDTLEEPSDGIVIDIDQSPDTIVNKLISTIQQYKDA